MSRINYKIPPKKAVACAALIALLGVGAAQLTLDTVSMYEGYVPEAYQDPVGIWTKCWGDTTGVAPGRTYTFDQCVKSLNDHVLELAEPVMKCVPSLALQNYRVKAAVISMAYNIGPGAFCKSSVARYFNAGDYRRGCLRIREIYKTAKGRELPGLVVRREGESELCLRGLDASTDEGVSWLEPNEVNQCLSG
jgi:lysozyme